MLAPGEGGADRDITLICNIFILYLKKMDFIIVGILEI